MTVDLSILLLLVLSYGTSYLLGRLAHHWIFHSGKRYRDWEEYKKDHP